MNEAQRSEAPRSTVSRRSPAVLVVDDEADLRELLSLTLLRLGLDVDTAESVAAARSLLARNRYSLCLTDMRLPDGTGLELVREVALSSGPPIAVITSGGLPPNPTELLESEKMNRILTELKEKSDIIILDSPPTIVADAIAMSVKMDGVLLVIEPGKTKIGAAQVLMEQLNRAGARILGVVLNPISRKRMHYYSKYQYYTTYYYTRTYDRYFSKNGANKRRSNGNGANHREKQHEEKTSAPTE